MLRSSVGKSKKSQLPVPKTGAGNFLCKIVMVGVDETGEGVVK